MKKRKRKDPVRDVVNFIAEAGLLKRVKRSGWSVLGISNAESVADHSFRCAVIGFLLARMERAEAGKVFLMTTFNDIHEARITDLHKMAQRYFDVKKTEDKSFIEQMNALPPDIRKELLEARREYSKQKTTESLIARDADILECLIQAKEYRDYGYSKASEFMKKAPGYLRTKSAKKIWKKVKTTDLNKWWFELSNFKR